jgi:hypothetical protein
VADRSVIEDKRTRRWRIAALVIAGLLLVLGGSLWEASRFEYRATGIDFAISAEERDLLEKVERAAFDFFWNECNTANGLIKDRAHFRYRTPIDYAPSSVAGAGYALSAYCIGAEKGWITRQQAYERCLRTLQFFKRMQNVKGFYYHFVDMKTGVRTWKSELSPIDTTLFLAGALHAGVFFRGTEVERLSRELYERIDWKWMLGGGRTLALGWTPEDGFQEWRWDHYCESLLMYLLAIGSPTHPIPASAWHEISRPIGQYAGYTCIASPPLFTHQYSHIWVDFRGRYDDYADYFQNSVQATLANRQFCIDEMENHATYGPNVWGLTASQAPDGYHAYGAKPGRALHDGTIAPTGALGSIVFTPRESLDFLKHMYREHPELWGHYGFTDAFNIGRNWQAQEVLAIDQGTIILMIDNFLTGSIWRDFMTIPEIRRAMEAVGFKEGHKTFDYSGLIFEYFESKAERRPSTVIPRLRQTPVLDGDPSEWKGDPQIRLEPKSNLENGSIQKVGDAAARIHLAWTDSGLYMCAVVTDDELLCLQDEAQKMHQDDALEIFIDPQNDQLRWGAKNEFQIGLTPSGPGEKPRKWCWFQDSDGGDDVLVSASLRANDYVLEAFFAWKFLGVEPRPGLEIGFTPALDDRDYSNSAKLTWFFLDPGITLGRATLGN